MRGLNRNHNRILKDVFKGAATAATAHPGPLQDFYHGVVARGTREELTRLTLTRKLAALSLHLWKRGERYDATQLTTPARQPPPRETAGAACRSPTAPETRTRVRTAVSA
jgi:hypothetical protein